MDIQSIKKFIKLHFPGKYRFTKKGDGIYTTNIDGLSVGIYKSLPLNLKSSNGLSIFVVSDYKLIVSFMNESTTVNREWDLFEVMKIVMRFYTIFPVSPLSEQCMNKAIGSAYPIALEISSISEQLNQLSKTLKSKLR